MKWATLLSPILDRIPLVGGLVGLAVMFCFYVAVLGARFELDQGDTWFCVCVIFLVRLSVHFVMLLLRRAFVARASRPCSGAAGS